MNDQTVREMLKVDLMIVTTAFDAYLDSLITVAKARIGEEGITLNMADTNDAMLVVQYAAFLYRRRRDEGTGDMPRMLRYALNNRLFAEKTAGAE